ncbi:MAG TPA: linear amide C-N hydrolase [Pirellulales bacterium]|nr:linear amide C-N hydrolase [Pirellulales bacterium]
MKRFFRSLPILGIFAFTAAACSSAAACTGITIRTQDGSIIFGRTLEFAVDFSSSLIVVPRGVEYVGTAPGDKPGLRWKSKYAVAGMNAYDQPLFGDVLQTFHILNQFDIPKGAARSREHGQLVADYTLWTTAADLKNLRYYFRTFENSRIRMLDLKALDLNAQDIKTISIQGDEQVEDVTAKAR